MANMVKQYTVLEPVTLSLNGDEVKAAGYADRVDNDGLIRLGPGEVIPESLHEHWYVQAQVAVGSVKEGEVRAPKTEEPAAKNVKSTG